MKKKQKTGKAKSQPSPAERGFREEMAGLFFMALSLFLFMAALKYQGTPEDNAAIGWLGTSLVLVMEKLAGTGLVLVPLLLALWSIHIMWKKNTGLYRWEE